MYTTRPQRVDLTTGGLQSGHSHWSSSHMGTLRQSDPGDPWNRTAQHTHEDAAGLFNALQVVWSRPRPLAEEVFFDVLPGLSLNALISSLLYRTWETWRSPQSEPVGSTTPGALSEGQRAGCPGVGMGCGRTIGAQFALVALCDFARATPSSREGFLSRAEGGRLRAIRAYAVVGGTTRVVAQRFHDLAGGLGLLGRAEGHRQQHAPVRREQHFGLRCFLPATRDWGR